MTRKDYVLIAASINESYKEMERVAALDAADNVNTYARTAIISKGVSVVMNNIADSLARENPRFDRKKFVSACINGKHEHKNSYREKVRTEIGKLHNAIGVVPGHPDAAQHISTYLAGLEAAQPGGIGFGPEHLAAHNAIMKTYHDRDALLTALIDLRRYRVLPSGLPDKGKGRTEDQQRALTAVNKLIAAARHA